MTAPRRDPRSAGPLGAALTLTLLLPGLSFAATPGKGIRLGDDARVVPSVTTGLEWQSNVYMTAGIRGTNDKEVRAANLMVNPAIRFESITTPAELTLSADLTARKFLSSATANLDRASDAGIGLQANILPRAAVGVRVEDNFFNENRPNEALFAERSEGGRAFISQLHNEAAGFISVHPGQALTVDVGGHFTFDNYNGNPNSNITGQSYLNAKNSYGFRMDSEWAFLPKTAIVADFDYSWNDWDKQALVTFDTTPGSEFADDLLILPDSQGFKLHAGLVGRFTRKLVVNTLVGYGRLVYSEDSVTQGVTENQLQFVDGGLNAAAQGWDANITGVSGIIGTAQLAYTPRKGHKISAGYLRDFEDSWFTNYVAYNYAFLSYEGAVSRRVKVGGDFGYRLETYEGDFSRQDNVLRVNANATYEPMDWLAITANMGFRQRSAARFDEEAFPIRATSEFTNFPVSLLFTFAY